MKEVPLLQALVLLAAAWVVLEIIFYVQLKAQAKLFLMTKVTDYQQTQLFNLLDSVPDKVLICSRNPEELLPKATYSNRQMIEFFGSNPVLSDEKVNQRKKKDYAQSSQEFESEKLIQRKRSVMNKKIFKVKEDPMRAKDKDFDMRSDTGDFGSENSYYHLTSLNEIVVRHQANNKPFGG